PSRVKRFKALRALSLSSPPFFPAVSAQHHHRRLLALWRWRHAGFRQWYPPTCRRTTCSEVQPRLSNFTNLKKLDLSWNQI
ncbi:hypothetical protein ERO13_D03G112700v2, partial [Gossypium hirsutum]